MHDLTALQRIVLVNRKRTTSVKFILSNSTKMWWVRGPRKELLLLVLKHVCLTSTSNTQRRTRLYRNEPGSGSQIPFMATRRQDNTFHLKLCQRANGPLISRMMKEIQCSRSLQITSKTSSGRLCNKAWSHIWRTEFVSFFLI